MKKKLINLFLLVLGNEFFLRLILKAHTISYILSSLISTKINKGIHPKHQILGYKEWFLSNIEPGSVVLDVGSNNGQMANILAKKASYIYGVEINKKLVDEAKKNFAAPNIQFINADATIYEYRNLRPVDVVILSNVLEHIEMRVDFLKKLIRNIKKNNTLNVLIRVPLIDRDWIVIHKRNMGVEWRLDKTHFIEYTLSEFFEELNEAELRVASYSVCWGEIWACCKVKK